MTQPEYVTSTPNLNGVSQPSARVLRLEFGGLGNADFDLTWLADNCPTGFHPQTGERTFDLLSLPDDLSLRASRIDDKEELVLVWAHDERESRFSATWLWEHRPGVRRADPAAEALNLWSAADFPDGPVRHNADRIMISDAALLDWLIDTRRFGLTLVEGIRGGGEASVALARRIGFLRETNFGVTFEVVNKPAPNNLAYTAIALPLHTDLANQELAPGLQFLHCIANEARGGGSVTADGFAIAEALRAQNPQAFRVLSQIAVPFRFFDSGADIRIRRPVIGLDADGRLRDIAFNAHLADLIDLPIKSVGAWYDAYRAFMRITRDPAYRLTFKLAAGEMMAFDNRRVFHGREAFDPTTGFRHLHGCYVDQGEFESQIRILSQGSSLHMAVR